MYAFIALPVLFMARIVASAPTNAPSPSEVNAWRNAIGPVEPTSTPVTFPEYTVPQPPGRQGQLHVIVQRTNFDSTTLAIIDSISDFNGPDSIAHTDQRTICTVGRWAGPGQHIVCSEDTWQVWYTAGTPAKLTVQRLVQYASNSPGGPWLRGRGASEIPVLIDAVPEPRDYSVKEFDATDLFNQHVARAQYVWLGDSVAPPLK